MELFLNELREYGVLGIVVCALSYVIWRFGQAVYKRLFDDNKGYVTILVDELIKFFHKTSENQDKQTEILNEMQIQNKNVDNQLAKIQEAQIKSINILDKLSCSNARNGSTPK